MKRLAVIFILSLMGLAVQSASATNLFDVIKGQAIDSLKKNATPVVQAFGQDVGGGLYHTASVHGLLGFDGSVQLMSVIVPNGKSSILDEANVKIIPLPVLQANVGLPMDFGVMVRGMGYKFQGQTLSLFGAGVKKDFSSMIPIPMFPHVGAMVAYHQFKGADIITANVFSFDIMASKNFIVVEPYIGYGFDRTSMKFKYDFSSGNTVVPISETFTENASRLTLGAKFSPFPMLNAYTDYNISKFNSFTLGLGVSFR